MDNNYFNDGDRIYSPNAEAKNINTNNSDNTHAMYHNNTGNPQYTAQPLISQKSNKNMKEMYRYYKYYDDEKKQPKVFSKSSIAILIIIFVLIIALTFYCVISDIAKGSLADNIMANVNKQFLLQTENKPMIDEQHIDESGKYTTEGIAQLLKPSIVEIFTYNKKISSFEPVGSGSGIIMSADGYIATNAHVLDNATEYKVVLSDGTD